MKFLLPLFLFAISGVLAQDKKCEAEYLVERCLETESNKPSACASDDNDCLCTAYEAIATCWNNCPDDDRAAAASTKAQSYCQKK